MLEETTTPSYYGQQQKAQPIPVISQQRPSNAYFYGGGDTYNAYDSGRGYDTLSRELENRPDARRALTDGIGTSRGQQMSARQRLPPYYRLGQQQQQSYSFPMKRTQSYGGYGGYGMRSGYRFNNYRGGYYGRPRPRYYNNYRDGGQQRFQSFPPRYRYFGKQLNNSGGGYWRGGGGRGRFSFYRGGRGRGRGGNSNYRSPVKVSKEELDKELDSYMAKTAAKLDNEIDAYMSEMNL